LGLDSTIMPAMRRKSTVANREVCRIAPPVFTELE
jgi:hypothetical protein